MGHYTIYTVYNIHDMDTGQDYVQPKPVTTKINSVKYEIQSSNIIEYKKLIRLKWQTKCTKILTFEVI